MRKALYTGQGRGGSLQAILAAMEPELYSLVVGCQTDQPLYEAFPAKRVLHGDIRGAMLPKGEWVRRWQSVLQQPGLNEKRAAYIHIPFCQSKCLYCGFFQNYSQLELENAYIDRLIAELKLGAGSPYLSVPVNAVFIGGGTPSSLSPANAGRLLKAIRTYLPLTNDCELTWESRVHDLVPAKMENWLENGVNRVSIGVQSFNTKVRQAAGRLDNREAILERLAALSGYNQATVIIDLIYGLPYQTHQVWLDDIALLKTAAVDGWDLYQLNVYENSALKKEMDAGRLPAAANVREKAELFAAAHHVLSGWPVAQISVCHWAKTSRERNMYNIMAQQGHTMLPFGAGAGGKAGDFSIMQEQDIKRYMQRIDSGEKPIIMMTASPASANLHDAVKNQIKLGYLDINQLAAEFDPRIGELEALLALWEKNGLVTWESRIVRLTVAGQFWYVNLMQSVLECINALLHGAWSWEMQQGVVPG
ncbi:Oxygen-independent coproporphyrinogen-III oxidase 1 [Sporomusa ovata DSM 2662]|uniref:Radical SAM family protein HutW, similar to coproporphyrinogen III oxidase, oxygen-independent, associated with heme uptake n=1 Tax=Sporomusa ovata TaxID=2378 RepID=A0A0U1KZQ1_9FIRM|nr:heme anaerobic degradation radical SAM methyltransferase ChuW/HutW [Sporomusa ovata]EQB27822.1 oxygen-independent coproporphyrinogen-III oxidase [Sporomusa ovata DSM 2662]CQR72755.1 Radical SAM family protein HutW, similar to coproporphyrinogen III oxidase, oxygen-independent, associated with heme uptake [Sporomusa ovata]